MVPQDERSDVELLQAVLATLDAAAELRASRAERNRVMALMLPRARYPNEPARQVIESRTFASEPRINPALRSIPSTPPDQTSDLPSRPLALQTAGRRRSLVRSEREVRQTDSVQGGPEDEILDSDHSEGSGRAAANAGGRESPTRLADQEGPRGWAVQEGPRGWAVQESLGGLAFQGGRRRRRSWQGYGGRSGPRNSESSDSSDSPGS